MKPKFDIVRWEKQPEDLYLVLDPTLPDNYQPSCWYVAHSLDEAQLFIECYTSCPLCDGEPCRNEGRCARDLADVEEIRLAARIEEHELEMLDAHWLDLLLAAK